jgi:hypothetical protein
MAKAKKKPAARKRTPKAAVGGALVEKRAKAYHDMEPHVCSLSRAAELAMAVFDQPELFLHAVGQLDDMTQRFRARYYAEEFPGDN